MRIVDYQNEHFDSAVHLLVAIAGTEPVHIEMSARGPRKYYDVHRRLNERDAHAHLLGSRTKGATLRYPNGRTRALCYDADTPDDWQLLQEAGRILAEHAYLPLLESSPAGRGGHLWIIFTQLVCAKAAQHHVLSLAPILQQICEYWPRATQKVRLPAGKYVKPGFAAWCTLTDAQGAILATNGRTAAHVLLTYQTLVERLPKAERSQYESGADAACHHRPDKQKMQTQARTRLDMGQVDTRWQKQYNSNALWFQFTPRQLAALYNERHPLSDILTLEQNGMAYSPSVEERTPSTAITNDGHAWVDFSARSIQPNGKHDGGDAFELAARRNGETRTAKSHTLREAARILVREARDALEVAAREGEDPPTWVASIMTEAGWQRYHSLRAESAVTQTSGRGLTGFQGMGITEHATRDPNIRETTQHTAPTRHNSPKPHQELAVLAAEIDARIGEPCNRCGCTLFYQSGPYQMCHLCYPRPVKLGRLTDEQWQQLHMLFPRTREPSDLFKKKNA
jgi:hypothetical protein